MPFTTPEQLRASGRLLSDAASEITRLQHNIESALLILDHFGDAASADALRHELVKDYGRAPR